MTAGTSKIVTNVKPDGKEQVKGIVGMLGAPFSLPVSRDEMDEAALHAMMERGLCEAKEDSSCAAANVFSGLRQEMQ